MSRLWKWIDVRKMSYKAKTRWFLFLNSLLYSAVGFFAWIIVSRFALDSWDWALCFVGYPGVFAGYFAGIIFLMVTTKKL